MYTFCFILAVVLALILSPDDVRTAAAIPKGALKLPFNLPFPNTPLGDRIVNGTNASKNEFPFIVSIRDADNDHFCGGSLWAPQWILTAAHCLQNGWDGLQVVVGAYDLDHPDTLQEQKQTVDLGITHKDYNAETYQNDIALLRVPEPFIINFAFVDIISSRNTATDPEPPQKAVLAGWGALQGGDNQTYPSILQKTTVDLFNDTKCAEIYAEASGIPIDMKIETCYLTPYTDSCQGDSGGPLVGYTNDNTALPYQEGVVSFGLGCADPRYPGVYVRLTAFVDWIMQTMADNSVPVETPGGGDIPIDIPGRK